MNAEGQLDTDEDGEEGAEGLPEGVLGEDNSNRVEGVVLQDAHVLEGLDALSINNADENSTEDDDSQEEYVRPNNEEQIDDRILHEDNENIEVEIIQRIHPAFAPVIPPSAPILLRRCGSSSSLDESSQRTSCKTSNDLCADPGAIDGRAGHRPSYHNQNHPNRVLERFKELRNNNELCDVTLVAGGHEVKSIY